MSLVALRYSIIQHVGRCQHRIVVWNNDPTVCYSIIHHVARCSYHRFHCFHFIVVLCGTDAVVSCASCIEGLHGTPCSSSHLSMSTFPPRAALARMVPSFHGQWCSRAHRSVARCPPIAASRPLAPRAPGVVQPRQHLQVPALSSSVTRPLIPRAPGVVQPLQHLQVPTPSGGGTTLCIRGRGRAPRGDAVGAGSRRPVGRGLRA